MTPVSVFRTDLEAFAFSAFALSEAVTFSEVAFSGEAGLADFAVSSAQAAEAAMKQTARMIDWLFIRMRLSTLRMMPLVRGGCKGISGALSYRGTSQFLSSY